MTDIEWLISFRTGGGADRIEVIDGIQAGSLDPVGGYDFAYRRLIFPRIACGEFNVDGDEAECQSGPEEKFSDFHFVRHLHSCKYTNDFRDLG